MYPVHRGLNVPGKQGEQKSMSLQSPSLQLLQFSLAVCVCVCVCVTMTQASNECVVYILFPL